ncbi:hypothetical protein PM8797T_00924 [Gimesia maris DSM 8797]|nr:hypothetical protein PM8797T_00924 [Gimesia maris DSM 8797]
MQDLSQSETICTRLCCIPADFCNSDFFTILKTGILNEWREVESLILSIASLTDQISISSQATR